jgi:hypothetical protein
LFSGKSAVEVDFPEVKDEDISGVPAQNIFASSSISDNIDSLDK